MENSEVSQGQEENASTRQQDTSISGTETRKQAILCLAKGLKDVAKSSPQAADLRISRNGRVI